MLNLSFNVTQEPDGTLWTVNYIHGQEYRHTFQDLQHMARVYWLLGNELGKSEYQQNERKNEIPNKTNNE